MTASDASSLCVIGFPGNPGLDGRGMYKNYKFIFVS